MIPVLELPVTRWWCRTCSFRDVTRQAEPHSRFHPCSGRDGLTLPMLREGETSRVVLTERQDYLGGADVPLVEGRPFMNATTEYPDGHSDVAVYAPTAYVDARAH